MRALCYVAGYYGRQLKRGDEWENIQRVIGVNILGGASSTRRWDWRFQHSGGKVRHYVFQDKYDETNRIPGIELIQYPIYMLEPPGSGDNILGQWLQLLTSAYTMIEVPREASPPIQEAYHLLELDKLPASSKRAYMSSVLNLDKYSQEIKRERREGKAEGRAEEKVGIARNLLGTGLSFSAIAKATGLTPEQISQLGKEET